MNLLDEALTALRAQEAAESSRSTCPECEGEGEWWQCGRCSEEFGAAIELRRTALLAASPAIPTARDGGAATHRHMKRGTEYVLIGFGKMQADGWLYDDGMTLVDMHEVAIYRSLTNPTELWVRPREEFEDGRFAALSNGAQP